MVQVKLTYNYEANIDIYAGVDVFYGNHDDLFGQFDETDRATIGIVWGF